MTDFSGTTMWNVYDEKGELDKVFCFASGMTPNDSGANAGISLD